MDLFDSWDEDEQRAFVCNFLCERWDALSADQKAAEILKMPQKCHVCGASGDGVQLSPDAAVGYTKLISATCALKVLQQEAAADGSDGKMLVSVRPHADWGWDPGPAAPIRIHGLAARADLNGQTGKLLSFDEASGRWCLRLDGSAECVRIKRANFTFHSELKFRLPEDGSTLVRNLREQVKGKIAPNTYMASQFSLWLSSPTPTRMEVDYADERGVWRPKRLRDYGVGVQPVESRALLVLISDSVKTPRGVPEELDPESDYCKARVWPSWMSHAEKERAHAELFGEEGRYEGPPHHPDVTPAGPGFDAAAMLS